jgi:hypothetical protein
MLWYQLLRPFGYILIRHPVKKMVDWYVPSAMAVIALAAIMPFRSQVNIWGPGGLIQLVQQLVQGLPGFYIAALAAVATFGQKTTLDVLIPEPTPTIETRYGGSWVSMQLTRRRFLCLLFAYLTSVSIALSLMAAYVQALAIPIRKALPPLMADVISLLVTLAYALFLFQLVIATLWGLYYLSDRMHQPD